MADVLDTISLGQPQVVVSRQATGSLDTPSLGQPLSYILEAEGTLATPGVATLTLTPFAPTVLAPRLVTPGVASLTTTRFAPVIRWAVIPGVNALSLTTFAPTVSATQEVLITVPKASLVLTVLAPVVTISGQVTPGTANLTLTRFAPTIVTVSNQPNEVWVETWEVQYAT